jgi:branched-chain amino acid transport system substrate-binding protein
VRRLLLPSIFYAVVGVFSLAVIPSLHAQNIFHNHIKMGVIVDLTGPDSAQGSLNLKGMEDYIQYVNETTSGIGGRKLALAVVDAGTESAGVLKDVEETCISEDIAMWAVWDAHMAEKAKALFVKHGIPHMDASNCHNLQSPLSYTYLPFGGTTLNCDAILQYIEKTHVGAEPPKVGILAANDACGKAILDSAEAYGVNHPLQIVAALQFAPGSQNLESTLLKLKDMGAAYILLQCAAPDAVTALKSADRIRYSVPFFSSWKVMNTGLPTHEKGLIRDRTIISFPGCLPGDGTPGIHLIKVLMDRYESVSRFHTAYWEGVSIAAIMARALQRARKTLDKIDGQTVNLALETFEREDFGALIPEVTYTETNHGASFVTRIVKVNENRTFTPLTKFWNPKTEEVSIIP